ncbi:hypothetical protein NQ314_009732 [Rhamnusium bicolor]|uniref:Cuticle protein n=1 Tax=Rhamnusium bicolor TaxID=1586634 RepID=A0AAV8XWE1_9CUCU|nr:hypothetical protein NQ314_009732 [Rhamnusium bicolor]
MKIFVVFAFILTAANAGVLNGGASFIQSAPITRLATPLAVATPVTKAVVPEPYDPNPQYSYGYEVQDPLTGDSHGQIETRSGDVVQGSYALLDSDGTKRVVEYTADPINGFNAVVSKQPIVAKALVAAPAIAKVAAPLAVPGPVAVPAPAAVPVPAPIAAAPLIRFPLARTSLIQPAPVSSSLAAPWINTSTLQSSVIHSSALPSPLLRTSPFAGAQLLGVPIYSPLLRTATVAKIW